MTYLLRCRGCVTFALDRDRAGFFIAERERETSRSRVIFQHADRTDGRGAREPGERRHSRVHTTAQVTERANEVASRAGVYPRPSRRLPRCYERRRTKRIRESVITENAPLAMKGSERKRQRERERERGSARGRKRERVSDEFIARALLPRPRRRATLDPSGIERRACHRSSVRRHRRRRRRRTATP